MIKTHVTRERRYVNDDAKWNIFFMLENVGEFLLRRAKPPFSMLRMNE